MRVLPVIDTLRVGGPGKGLISLIVALRDSVEFPGVVTFRGGTEAQSDFSRALSAAGIAEIAVDESVGAPWRSLAGLRHVIEGHRPDIVQTHGYKANFFLALEALRAGTARDWRWVSWVHGYTAENPKVLFFNKLEHWSAPRSDLTIFVSRSLKDVVRMTPRKWEVVPNGIDSTYEQVSSIDVAEVTRQLDAAGTKIILVVGRYSHEKGQDRIPGIAAKLGARRNDFRFILVGEGPAEEDLRTLIEREGVGDLVELHPFVSDIRPYYRAATLCVLPSRREGMPNVVLEALLMGCPLVSMDVGGVKEIVSPGVEALVVPQDDVDSVVRAIESVLDDDQLRKRLSATGRERIRDSFLAASRARRVRELYEDLLTGAGRSDTTNPAGMVQS